MLQKNTDTWILVYYSDQIELVHVNVQDTFGLCFGRSNHGIVWLKMYSGLVGNNNNNNMYLKSKIQRIKIQVL